MHQYYYAIPDMSSGVLQISSVVLNKRLLPEHLNEPRCKQGSLFDSSASSHGCSLSINRMSGVNIINAEFKRNRETCIQVAS